MKLVVFGSYLAGWFRAAEACISSSYDLAGQAMLVGVADWLALPGLALHWVVVYIWV